jgi:hypothetical protein
MWQKIRIVILLFVLATVAQQSLLKDGAPRWNKTLYVTLYPISADGSGASASSIATLDSAQFEEVESYFNQQASRYQLTLNKPFALRLGAEVKSLPPAPDPASMWSTMLWSLKFRNWVYHNSPATAVPADVRLYVLFYDPATHPILKHSTALTKGRIGQVNVFASKAYQQQNNMVIAHELLHTVAATDKYDLTNNLPMYPQGYAEPERQPLYPQTLAELMAGRTPVAESKAVIPEDLLQTLVGQLTAKEIGWVK